MLDTSRRLRPLPLLALLVALAPPAPTRGEAFFDLHLGATHDDNHNRARPDDERRADAALGAELTAGWRVDVGTASSLSLSAGLAGTSFDRFSRLDHADLVAGVAWRSKLGLGPTAPHLRLGLEARAEDSRSALRSGRRWLASARLARAVGDRWQLAGTYAYEHRDADDATFDHRGHSLFLTATAAVGDASSLVLRYQGRQGDVTSVAAPSPRILAAAEVRANDDAYEEPGWIAYRLDATTHVIGIALEHPLNDHAIVDLRLERQWTRPDASGLDYHNRVLRLALGWSF